MKSKKQLMAGSAGLMPTKPRGNYLPKKTNTKNPNPNMVVLAGEIALVLVLYCTREFPPCDSLFKSQRIYF